MMEFKLLYKENETGKIKKHGTRAKNWNQALNDAMLILVINPELNNYSLYKIKRIDI